jgi:hypothetical protein
MKLSAIFLVFKDEHFIRASFQSIYPVVDSICCVTANDRNLKGDPLQPDGTIRELLSLPDPQNKLRLAVLRNTDWVPGEDGEARLRNGAMRLAPDADYYLIVDADEVHLQTSLKAAWKYVQQTRWAGYRMSSITHFKSWNYCIEPNEGYRPLVFLRRGFYFREKRQIDWHGFQRWREYLRKGRKPKMEVLNHDWYYHHGAYVGDDERMATKVCNWSHADEVVPGWYEEKWVNFTSQSSNLHPVNPKDFPGVKYMRTEELPREVANATWPPGWIERA